MTDGRSLRQLFSDRLDKRELYASASYWNMKARVYSGLARSNWPSNAYNNEVHSLQMRVIDHALPVLEGREVLDVGCGTGRTSAHIARRGAVPSGFDFAETAVHAARSEVARLGLTGDFRIQSVLSLDVPEWERRFDVLISVGCLTLACRTAADFEVALSRLLVTLKPTGTLLFVEPIHRSRLFSRILRMSVSDWTARCAQHGLALIAGGPLCFAPVRFLLAYRPLPNAVTGPLFQLGERVLDTVNTLGDYRWLLFRQRGS